MSTHRSLEVDPTAIYLKRNLLQRVLLVASADLYTFNTAIQ